jgi:hypothetical protein
MRQINLGESIYSEDEEDLLFYISEDGKYKWSPEDCEYADWKDDQEKFDGVAAVAAKGGETVILFDGSDCYIFASMADAITV